MSLQSKMIGLAKKAKKELKKVIKASNPPKIYPVRRINGVKLEERICAMTFDDGPCSAAPNPDNSGKSLTLTLIETLEKHGAKGTFDCVGDTSENYPDEAGEIGTALWGGKAYDHYPDFEKDSLGGIKNNPELTKRILKNHEITCHSYVHRIWGKKPFVYGGRKYMGNIEDVVNDLKRFDNVMKDGYSYQVMLGRPPHYVDKIDGRFTSYDAYAMLGYQYLGAGPDGGGWLPLASYEAEVEAMRKAVAAPLEQNPDAFCGAIIFQKDGCNMAKRTPVADALDLQLAELDKYGYKVVSVRELMELSAFSDLSPKDKGYDVCKAMLDRGMCPAFSDNCIHPEKPVTAEELAMAAFGWEAVRTRVNDGARLGSAYRYAQKIAGEKGLDTKAVISKTTDRLEAYGMLLEIIKDGD